MPLDDGVEAALASRRRRLGTTAWATAESVSAGRRLSHDGRRTGGGGHAGGEAAQRRARSWTPAQRSRRTRWPHFRATPGATPQATPLGRHHDSAPRPGGRAGDKADANDDAEGDAEDEVEAEVEKVWAARVAVS